MHPYFLISCVGAYHDSGIGTGGFVSINNKKISVIDHQDCTGLTSKDHIYYRFIRSLKSLISYDKNGLKGILKLPEVSDAHDILIRENEIICVSTGTNEILFYDVTGLLKSRWKADGNGDAWHLNCLALHNNHLYISAFGQFKNHREWNEKENKEKGFIMQLDSKKIIVDSLNGPHHPRFLDGKWFICNSHKNSLKIIEDNKEPMDINLGGFTRGINFDQDYIYVGVNANRKDPNSVNASIKVLNRTTYELVDSIEIPFPEIYDIILADKQFVENIEANPDHFQMSGENDIRIKNLEKQVTIGLKEIEKYYIENQRLKETIKNHKQSIMEKIYFKIKRKFKK